MGLFVEAHMCKVQDLQHLRKDNRTKHDFPSNLMQLRESLICMQCFHLSSMRLFHGLRWCNQAYDSVYMRILPRGIAEYLN